jgi:hypothetical protein
VNNRLIIVACIVAICPGLRDADAREPRLIGLRPVNRFATEVIEAARARSATVRDLERAIESSNIVAYVNSDWQQAGGSAASMRWLTEAAGIRYVLVFVDIQVAPNRRIELLAHELRHVVELAGATWVHTESDMRRLYEETGRSTSRGGALNWFETAAAQASEAQAHRDLWDLTTPVTESVMALARK